MCVASESRWSGFYPLDLLLTLLFLGAELAALDIPFVIPLFLLFLLFSCTLCSHSHLAKDAFAFWSQIITVVIEKLLLPCCMFRGVLKTVSLLPLSTSSEE